MLRSFSRRYFFFGALGAPAVPRLAAQSQQAAGRPNILLILADDLGAWMLGCYGNKEIRTPNLDELARGGTRFQFSFVCTPICSASRATLFTGRLPRQHGIQDFLTEHPVSDPPQGQAAPPPSFKSEIMISDVLAGQGYECGYIGKWHMGDDTEPQHQCRFWYTLAGGARSYQNPSMSWNGQVVEEKGYLADLLTAKASEFLGRQNGQKPFFLTVSYLNPHLPYEGHPQKYYDLYARTSFDGAGWQPMAPNALREKEMMKDPVANLRKCAAAVTALDDQIPVLIRQLRERRLWENTLVIFCGDNGFLAGRHGLWSKGLASNPINMYDEVMAVPMIWNWPGKIPVQQVRPELVSFYDVMPTLCEIAGAPAPAGRRLAGRSYAPLLFNRPLPKKEPWRNTVFGHFRNTEMARDSRYKLVLRDGGSGPGELYDLRSDPRENVNQYSNPQYLNTRDRLAAEIAAWNRQFT
jgi:arylsulfatase A-like enzyme